MGTHLKIQTKNGFGKVLLNGNDMTEGCVGIELKEEPGCLSNAILHYRVEEVDVEIDDCEVKEVYNCHAEKEEGCDYCKNSLDNTRWEPGAPHEFRIYKGAIYYYDDNSGWEGEIIHFCPWCGRPLDEI